MARRRVERGGRCCGSPGTAGAAHTEGAPAAQGAQAPPDEGARGLRGAPRAGWTAALAPLRGPTPRATRLLPSSQRASGSALSSPGRLLPLSAVSPLRPRSLRPHLAGAEGAGHRGAPAPGERAAPSPGPPKSPASPEESQGQSLGFPEPGSTGQERRPLRPLALPARSLPSQTQGALSSPFPNSLATPL